MSGRERRGEELGRAPRRADIPPLEWGAALLGAVLLAGALAFMVRQALVSDDSPGPVAFEVKRVLPLGAGFLVEFEARNRGDATYAELEVEGTLRGASGTEERARATLDYLPGRSSREGGLFFRGDPAAGELELAARGYRRP